MSFKEFKFKYSAPTEEEKRELQSIKERYIPVSSGDRKLERVRRLDRYVKSLATTAALSLGIVGTLTFGLGMATVLEWNKMLLGCIISAVGLIPVIAAYPFYVFLLAHNKKKYGAEILKLTAEILNGK